MGIAQIGNGAGPEKIAGLSAADMGDNCPQTLLLVSDIRFLREGLAEVLARDGAFAIVGAADDLVGVGNRPYLSAAGHTP